MNKDNIASVRQAIADKKVLVCTYRGFRRDLCPHALGWKNGRRHLIAFQFGGENSTGLRPGGDWICLSVDDLKDLQMRDGPWRTAPDYRRILACFDVFEMGVEL